MQCSNTLSTSSLRIPGPGPMQIALRARYSIRFWRFRVWLKYVKVFPSFVVGSWLETVLV